MKKVIRISGILVLAIMMLIIGNRYKNISKYYEYEGNTYIHVVPNVFIKSPNESWLNLSEFDMDSFLVSLIVEDYNSLFRTWSNELECSVI